MKTRKEAQMSDLLNDLASIEARAAQIGDRIRHEEAIMKAELEDRQRLGLHGDAAIEHYNSWMEEFGLFDLKV